MTTEHPSCSCPPFTLSIVDYMGAFPDGTGRKLWIMASTGPVAFAEAGTPA